MSDDNNIQDKKKAKQDAIKIITDFSSAKICLLPFSDKISNQKVKDFFTLYVDEIIQLTLDIIFRIPGSYSSIFREKERISSRRLFWEILFVIFVIIASTTAFIIFL